MSNLHPHPDSPRALVDTQDAALITDNIKSPLYMQVYSSIYQWIAQGHYAPGACLEPESRLCEMFGVSRITVRKAIELLAREGLVHSLQGKGTFVSMNSSDLPVRADMDQRVARAKQLARSSKTADVKIEQTAATGDVLADLNLKSGTEVLFASYVRVMQKLRIGYVESRIPLDLGIALEPHDFHDNTMLTIMEAKGVMLSGIDHLIGATLADSRLARILKLQVGAPLVRIKMIMLDTQHRPVDQVLAFFRADHYEHHMFMARSAFN